MSLKEEALAQDIYEQSCVLWAAQVAEILVKHKVAKPGSLDNWVAERQVEETTTNRGRR